MVLDRSRTAGLHPNGCSRSLVLPQLVVYSVVLWVAGVGVRPSGRFLLGRAVCACLSVCERVLEVLSIK